MMLSKIFLFEGKESTVLRGHPWIFPKAIQKHEGPLKTGELLQVHTATGEFLGCGVYNEHSLYRVRLLSFAQENISAKTLNEIIEVRLQQAYLLRKALSLPNRYTNAYRFCNSEADGLSGLTIDRFSQVLVVSSSAFWVEANRPTIMTILETMFPEDKILWISQAKSLAQDGFESDITPENSIPNCIVLENGIQYEVNFSNAQKTGLFLDQRENHKRIEELAAGKRVLDLYTYVGGFALHAAKGGANAVTAVDSSEQAIQTAKKNAELNTIDSIDFIADDARNYLERAGEYDLIILDPPKLIPSKKHLQKAKNYYRFLHREIFKNMHPGSLLLTCNCSAAISTTEFTQLVAAQALMVGKTMRVLGVYGPSSCHPTLPAFPEGNYLTAILVGIL